MSRARVAYADGGNATARDGANPDVPVAGHYRMRLRSGGVFVAVHLWHGAPIEPWTGEMLDRAPRWNATVNGQWADVATVWPRCAGEPITAAEAEYLAATHAWAKAHAPDSPQADPRRRINPLTAPTPF